MSPKRALPGFMPYFVPAKSGLFFAYIFQSLLPCPAIPDGFIIRFRPAYVAAGLSAFAIIEARINGYRSKYVLPFIIGYLAIYPMCFSFLYFVFLPLIIVVFFFILIFVAPRAKHALRLDLLNN